MIIMKSDSPVVGRIARSKYRQSYHNCHICYRSKSPFNGRKSRFRRGDEDKMPLPTDNRMSVPQPLGLIYSCSKCRQIRNIAKNDY